MQKTIYPPISDYGYIGDCHSSALISKNGSIDWCCMPMVNSPSCFGRLLDWEKGGYCQIAPKVPYQTTRRYIPKTMILETHFKTENGEVRLLDFFPMRRGGEHKPHQQIIRIIEGISGEVELQIDIQPKFDYGTVSPWIKPYGDQAFTAIGGNSGLLITGYIPLVMPDRHQLSGECRLVAGKRAYLAILFRKPEELDEGNEIIPEIKALKFRYHATLAWWRRWVQRGMTQASMEPNLVLRSALVLKALSNAPTGAIAAAATTSLPEALGGTRNWDYRFSWVRDAFLTVVSLERLGFTKESFGFKRFIERTSAGSAEELQIVFGVDGQRDLKEDYISELEGYYGSQPVRVGNGAVHQVQLDIYGYLLVLAWHGHRQGQSPDDDYWTFLLSIINSVLKNWQNPDRGIWEIRADPRHYVYSKVMCWVALDRGIQLAKELNREAPLEEWRLVRDAIRLEIEEKGYDAQRGIFIQAYNFPQTDAALLLLPAFGFIDYKDERAIRTAEAIWKDLNDKGLIRRYLPESDGLEGEEGIFIACSFWLAIVFARQGKITQAEEIFNRATATANDLGLFSEEFDMNNNQMLGNFPQAFTHLSFIGAAIILKNPDISRGL